MDGDSRGVGSRCDGQWVAWIGMRIRYGLFVHVRYGSISRSFCFGRCLLLRRLGALLVLFLLICRLSFIVNGMDLVFWILVLMFVALLRLLFRDGAASAWAGNRVRRGWTVCYSRLNDIK